MGYTHTFIIRQLGLIAQAEMWTDIRAARPPPHLSAPFQLNSLWGGGGGGNHFSFHLRRRLLGCPFFQNIFLQVCYVNMYRLQSRCIYCSPHTLSAHLGYRVTMGWLTMVHCGITIPWQICWAAGIAAPNFHKRCQHQRRPSYSLVPM